MENLITQSMRGTRLTSSSGFKRRSSDQLGNKNSIRSEIPKFIKNLNSPQGNVASKIAASIKMLNSLETRKRISERYQYDALNLLSCMKLDVENIHLVVHHKDQLFTVLDCVRKFGNAAKEGLKRTTR